MIGHNAPVCVDEFISENEAKIRAYAENASKLSLLVKVARLAKSNLKKIQCPFGAAQQGTFISPGLGTNRHLGNFGSTCISQLLSIS